MEQTNDYATKESHSLQTMTKRYPAKHFINKEDNKALVQLIEQNSLATLLYIDNNAELHVSHIPFHFNESPRLTLDEQNNDSLLGYELMGHVSNDHPVAHQLKNKSHTNITLIFHSEEDYISPNDVNIEHGGKQNVPTWNYAKVHVSGDVEEITDIDDKYQQMIKTTDYFEETDISQNSINNAQGPISNEKSTHWTLETVPKRAIESMFKAITLFTLTITDIEGRFKVSQNKPDAIRKQIAEQVAKRNKQRLAEKIHSS